MRIGLRILLGYFLIVALAAILLTRVFVQEVKPGVRQTMEDTLVDTANLLAAQATDDLLSGQIDTGRFAASVRALAEVAHAAGLGLHMDGARFANALVALDCSPADITWRAGVDILSFGATKNGALGAEAIIVFDLARAKTLPFLRKRGGHLLSKQRFAAAQFEAYLSDDLWRRNAAHANAMAKRLAEGLRQIRGVRLPHPVEANALFPVLPETMQARLRAAGFLFGDWGEAGSGMVRLIASFDTAVADVDRFLDVARAGETR